MPLHLTLRPIVARKSGCRYTVRVRLKADEYSFSFFRRTIFEKWYVAGIVENGSSQLAFVRWLPLALLAESLDKISVLQTEANEANITLLGRSPT